MSTCIYLDNAATTFPKPQPVIDAVNKAMMELSVNAGRGSYNLAKEATAAIEECREALIQLSGLSTEYGVIFTPSATIAMNQVVFGIETTNNSNLYVTPFEHNSVLRPVGELCSRIGCTMHILPFDKETWEFDIAACRSMFAANPPTAVFATLVSNVTGYELPIHELSKLTHEFDGLCIVDASQALGAVDFSYRTANADAYIFAGHKTLYGPFGIGGMLARPSILKKPLIYGGTGSDSLSLCMPDQFPTKFEASSPNIVAISGLNSGIKWLNSIGISAICSHERILMNELISNLRKCANIELYLPPDSNRHHSILAFTYKDLRSDDAAAILNDDYGIAVRSGFHCAAYCLPFVSPIRNDGCVRIGLSYFNDMDNIVTASKAILEIA